LAFDFGGTKLAIARIDEAGTIERRITIAVKDHPTASQALARAIQAGLEFVQELLPEQLVGIGLSTMGITLSDKVIMAPNIPGWATLRIREEMEQAFPGVAVKIENDMKASCLAELRRGALRGTRSGLYVNMGTGFGVALTLGNQVVPGAHGAAGEMAYNLRSSLESLGFRDGVAPFEDFVGGRAIGERARVQFGQRLTAKDVFAAAERDPGARTFVDATVREMAYQLTNLVISWDPEKVVFGGGMVASHPLILPRVNEYFERFVPFPPMVEIAHFQQDAGLHGAIELAREAAGFKID